LEIPQWILQAGSSHVPFNSLANRPTNQPTNSPPSACLSHLADR
jgi:hypothetical protein